MHAKCVSAHACVHAKCWKTAFRLAGTDVSLKTRIIDNDDDEEDEEEEEKEEEDGEKEEEEEDDEK